MTLDEIVDAACDLGFARIEMAAVARRLNTGVATLYGYVRGREHLLQLVAERLAQRSHPEDHGQDWRQLLREHAGMAEATFRTMPHLIGELLAAQHLNHARDYARRVIAMLTRRGFALDDAIDIYVETTQIVLGAAICAERRRIAGDTGGDEAGGFPMPAIIGDHRPTLERLIRDVEATRSPVAGA